MHADLVIVNANIRTMDGGMPACAAIAVGGNRIIGLGTVEEVGRTVGPATEVIDAQGRTVLPGFHESHMHLFDGGASLGHLNLAETFGEEVLRQRIAAFASANPEAGLLVCFGANYTMLGDGTRPDRHALDRLLPDRPLYIMATDYHTGWANSIALDRAGLLRGCDVGPGAEVVLGSDGTATGELREFAAMERIKVIRTTGGREGLGMTGQEPENVTPAQREEDLEMLRRGLGYCARHGITSIANMDGNFYQLDLLRELEESGDLICRVEVPYALTPDKGVGHVAEAVEMARRFASDKLRSGRVKMFLDGVIDTWTACMVGDYADRPGFGGAPLFEPGAFRAICAAIDREGLQISVHAVGDGAVRLALDGYAAARRANGARDSRHRIEHIDTIHPDDVPRLAELGVVASMQPVHVPGSAGLPLEPTTSLMGRARWPWAFAWRTLRDAGATIAFATDWPISPLDPLHAIRCALTRRPWADDMPDQRLSLDECLAAYTTNGAFASFAEDRLGRLRPGLLADMVMIDGDPGSGEDAVVLTICDGRVTHRKTA